MNSVNHASARLARGWVITLLNREDDRLQVITVAELFDHPGRAARRLDLPMARADAVKSAPAVADDNQGKLGI